MASPAIASSQQPSLRTILLSPTHIAHLIGHVTHLCAAGIWLGGLIPLWRALGETSEIGRSQLVGRFSMMGYGAVALMALTGAMNFWFITGNFLPSLSSTYGQLIALKLGLVALLLVIVLFNQFYATRRGRWSHLRQGIAVELGVFAAVLLVVGLLGVTPPMS